MTGWDIGLIFLALVLASFVMGFVETWWEKRKWDKQNKER
ncbi:hypothetical protein ES705_46556 [subsurface metagenome]|jgi:hypothetical protein